MEKEMDNKGSVFIILLSLGIVVGVGLVVYAAGYFLHMGGPDAHLDLSDFIVNNLKPILLISFGAILFCIGNYRRDFQSVYDDSMTTYKKLSDYIDKAYRKETPLGDVPAEYEEGDLIITSYELEPVGFMDYLLNYKNFVIKPYVDCIKRVYTFNIEGTVKKMGNFYKIGNYLVHRTRVSVLDGENVNVTIKSLAKQTDKYKDTIIIW